MQLKETMNRLNLQSTVFIIIPSQVPIYSEGDKVIVINDEAKVRQLQKGHGGWVDDMASV